MSNPLHGRPVEFMHLLAHQVLPPAACTVFEVPRRARVTAETYGGETVTIVADVVARSRDWMLWDSLGQVGQEVRREGTSGLLRTCVNTTKPPPPTITVSGGDCVCARV